MDPLLLPEEVAALLRVDISTLRNWRSKGRGPKFVKIGDLARYRLADVEAYVSASLS